MLERIATTVLAVTVLGVGGCGDDGADEETAAQHESAAGDTAAVAALVKRCGIKAALPGAPRGVFPAGLLPAPWTVTAIEPDRVVVLVGRDLRSTYQAIVQQAEQGDVTITKRDFEGFEAELSLTGADGEMEIELQPQPECDGATRAVVRSED